MEIAYDPVACKLDIAEVEHILAREGFKAVRRFARAFDLICVAASGDFLRVTEFSGGKVVARHEIPRNRRVSFESEQLRVISTTSIEVPEHYVYAIAWFL